MTEGSPLESGCEVADDTVIKCSGLINQGFLYCSGEKPVTKGWFSIAAFARSSTKRNITPRHHHHVYESWLRP